MPAYLSRSEKIFHKNLSEYIKKTITENKTTPNELARRMKVSRAQIYEYMQGRSMPNVRSLVRLGQVMGLKLEVKFIPEDEDDDDQ